MSTHADVPGNEAIVHQSVLRPTLALGAPQQPAMLNFFVSFAMIINMRVWLYTLIGVAIHGALMLVARHDHFIVSIFQASFRRRSYYGV